MKVGDHIVWTSDLDDPAQLRTGVVTKMHGTGAEALCWVDNHQKAEDCIYQAYCWPAKIEPKLRAALEERARLKKQYQDSITLIFVLRNRATRGEFD